VCLLFVPAGLSASPQPPDPTTLSRIRTALNDTPPKRLKLDAQAPLPVATFKTSVEQRVYVLSFREALQKEFRLTDLQRQYQQWASQCCGIDILGLMDSGEKRLQRRRARKIHEEVTRELAQIEAAAKK
jgi:hypothetical protein